jgi:hypothetical protein
LFLLSHRINWQLFEDAFSKHYNEKKGAPSKPIRLIVSLLILKQVRNLSDENLVEHWNENVYYQYFSGEQLYRPSIPSCSSTQLVAFRKGIGEARATLILKKNMLYIETMGMIILVELLVLMPPFKKRTLLYKFESITGIFFYMAKILFFN